MKKDERIFKEIQNVFRNIKMAVINPTILGDVAIFGSEMISGDRRTRLIVSYNYDKKLHGYCNCNDFELCAPNFIRYPDKKKYDMLKLINEINSRNGMGTLSVDTDENFVRLHTLMYIAGSSVNEEELITIISRFDGLLFITLGLITKMISEDLKPEEIMTEFDENQPKIISNIVEELKV